MHTVNSDQGIDIKDCLNLCREKIRKGMDLREKQLLRVFDSFNYYAIICGAVASFGFSAVESVQNRTLFFLAQIILLGAIIFCVWNIREESFKALVDLDRENGFYQNKRQEINKALANDDANTIERLKKEFTDKAITICLDQDYGYILDKSLVAKERSAVLVGLMSIAFLLLVASFIRL